MKFFDGSQFTLTFHDATKTRPDKSGDALVFTPHPDPTLKGHLDVMGYSKKHDAFNAYDSCKDTENAILVSYWAELPTTEGRS